MKLTEAIKQKRFKTEMEKAVVNILFTSSWLNYQQSAVFKEFGITMKQFNILRILKGQYPKAATVNLLIDRMIDKSSNASRIVDKLVEKGLVERTSCPEDRRRGDIIISDSGMKIVNQASQDIIISDSGMKIVNQASQRLEETKIFSHSLSENEAQKLNQLLDKLRTKE